VVWRIIKHALDYRLMGKGRRLVVVLVSMLGSTAVLAGYIWISVGNNTSQRESAAWTVVLWIFQVLLGVVLGEAVAHRRAQAEYQPFLKSAIRRTHGLRNGLERAQASMGDSWERVAEVAGEDPRVQLVVWHEQLNGVYSQLTELVAQADSSIDDWRDVGVADEEFAKIMLREDEREQKISLIVSRLGEVQRTKQNLADSTSTHPELEKDLNQLSKELEQQLQGLKQRVDGTSPLSRGDTRHLIIQGANKEAVERYSELILAHPESHGHYVGRAQAHYQLGNLPSAIADLDTARVLAPEETGLLGIRAAMLSGTWTPRMAADIGTQPYLPVVGELFKSIEDGHPEDSLKLAAEAKALGLNNPAFNAINFAMAYLLNSQSDEARACVDELLLRNIGPFVRVNTCALDLILAAQMGEDLDWDQLREAFRNCPTYGYDKSPLFHLERGLRRRGILHPLTAEVFTVLRRAVVPIRKVDMSLRHRVRTRNGVPVERIAALDALNLDPDNNPVGPENKAATTQGLLGGGGDHSA
jgi:tetratricopeptide (TPR) repeat protein